MKLENSMKWVVEWSEEQKEFHIDTLQSSIERNRRAYFLGRKAQYIIVSLANDIHHAGEICEQLRLEKQSSNS